MNERRVREGMAETRWLAFRETLAEYLRLSRRCRSQLRNLLEEQEHLDVLEARLLEMVQSRIDPGWLHPFQRDLHLLVDEFERSVILWALAASSGQQNRAATLLGTAPSTLSEKLKRLGISPFEKPEGADKAPWPQGDEPLRTKPKPRPAAE